MFIAVLIIGLALFPVSTYRVNNSLTNKLDSFANRFVDHSLVVIAALFLLSPTGYPWYAAWMLPLLVLRPNPALLLLTATLPLYDVRYYLAAAEQEAYWLPTVTALQFAPSCIWLIWQRRKSSRYVVD